jgi:hypothetical protein
VKALASGFLHMVAPASRVTETKTYHSTEKQGSQRLSLGRGFEVASSFNTVQLFASYRDTVREGTPRSSAWRRFSLTR